MGEKQALQTAASSSIYSRGLFRGSAVIEKAPRVLKGSQFGTATGELHTQQGRQTCNSSIVGSPLHNDTITYPTAPF